MATLALAVNLVTYFNGFMHFELADAANQLTNYMGVSYILSILMGTLADIFVGRFKTALISGTLEFMVCFYHAHSQHDNKIMKKYSSIKPSATPIVRKIG